MDLFANVGRMIDKLQADSSYYESSMDVGNCFDPGCYSRAINYNATSSQMSASAELSTECHQSISVCDSVKNANQID
jgi:hypothetical protein